MNMTIKLITLSLSTSLLMGCAGMVGNVVPQQGKTMEQVYDGMSQSKQAYSSVVKTHQFKDVGFEDHSKRVFSTSGSRFDQEFRKAVNPPLRVYVYPHLAGYESVPVPGYYTEFPAYDHDRFVLPNELLRG